MKNVWENPKIRAFMTWLKEEGFTNIRLFFYHRKFLRLRVQQQSLKQNEYGSSEMYIVEAAWNGEYCCVYMSFPKKEEGILRILKKSAGMFGNREIPKPVLVSRDLRGQRWRPMDTDAVSDYLKCAEQKALACEKIHFVEVCEYQQYEETIVLLDETMNYLADDDGNRTFTVRVVAKDGDCTATAVKYGIVGWEQADFCKEMCMAAMCAAKHAGLGLHAQKIASGSYPIVLENCVMAELTEHYITMFFGENIMHHASALAGKKGQRIGCADLRIEEDPFSWEGTVRRRIDDEGVPVTKTVLVSNGVFKNVLYDKKSAAEAKEESTGNGFKPGVTEDIGTGVTNVFLSSEKETFSRREMIASAEGGIYVTKIEGMFAGADTESGDFSLMASGNRIEQGSVGTAVNQFTISGNICELWKGIEMIGDDPVYRMSSGTCTVSPSVKVGRMVVSGE